MGFYTEIMEVEGNSPSMNLGSVQNLVVFDFEFLINTFFYSSINPHFLNKTEKNFHNK